MKTKFLKIPSALLICSLMVSSTTPFANAALLDRPPNLVASCDPYLEEGSTIPAACRDATLNGACTGTKTLHDAVVGSVAGSIAYGATSLACLAACIWPAAQMGCTYASALSGIGDMLLGQNIGGDANRYVRETENNQHVLEYLDAVRTINQIGSIASTLSGVVGMASGSGGTAARSAACIMMVVGAGLSITKGVNADIFYTNMQKHDQTIGELVPNVDTIACRSPQNQPGRAPSGGPNNSGESLNVNPLGINRLANSGPNRNTTEQPNSMANVMAGASRATSGDKYQNIRKDSLGNMKNALASIEKNFGMNADQLIGAFNNGASITDLLSKSTSDPAFQNLFKEISANKGKIASVLGGPNAAKNALAANYTSVNRGGGGKGNDAFVMPDLSALLGKKGKGGAAGEDSLSNVSTVGFGNTRDNGTDIWHSKSTKSIFEIVSDRFVNVVQRFRTEDSQVRAETAFGVPTQTQTPENSSVKRSPASTNH